MGLFSPKIPTRVMVPLCRQLATSYSAGIPILRTLDLVRANIKHPRTREVLSDIHGDISSGATLTQASRRQKKYLPLFFIELLSSGESGGKLDTMLRDLAEYYEDRLALRRMVIGKVAYPAIQLGIAWFIGTFALMLIRSVTFGTKKFSLANYVAFYLGFQFVALLILAAIVVSCIMLARMGVFKWIWGYVATYVWPLKPVTQRLGTARFFRCMSLLIGSGLPIMRCIEASAAATSNPYLQKDFLRAVPFVKEGATLADAFGSSQFLSRQALEMVRVGEEAGQLEDALRRTSEYQRDEAVHAVDLAAKAGEALLIIVVGLVVGYIVISFWGGYYKRIDEITRIR